VYTVCRQQGCAVTLLDVADLVGDNVFKVARAFHKLASSLKLSFAPLTPAQYIDRILSPLIPPEMAAAAQNVKDTVSQLLDLAQSEWILMGKNPISVAAAACTIALQAHHLPTQLVQIAQSVKIARKTLAHRIREFHTVFLRLAKVLPWSKDVTPEKIHTYLPFIVHNLAMLRDIEQVVQQCPQAVGLVAATRTLGGEETGIDIAAAIRSEQSELADDVAILQEVQSAVEAEERAAAKVQEDKTARVQNAMAALALLGCA